MIAATSWKGSICFWDLEAGKLIKKQRNKYAGLQLTSDGHQAISRSGNGRVLWEMETGKKIRTIVGASSGLMGSLISPHNRWVCEISPFKYKDLRGEVQAVRPWTDEDAPYTGSGRVDFSWIDDERLTTWRHVRRDDGKQVWCEVLVWSLHPLKITAVAQLERRQMLIDGGPQSTVRGEIYRLAAASDGRTIFLGDGDAHVYAFNVPS
ncbi:WD40 repeat domain-containing protein [Candidatus Laterigemmans baculatus]|uniref:hypothetical protein n=1 Tax=Candidatus Laterigemmans baculatus TaxID=2770505 RepID=UPI0013DB19DC|nr:hypothetical protein [Candidatus Laterigemmans baculatus]